MRQSAQSNVDTYRFSPEERAVLPGAPFVARHSSWRRAAYAGTALLLGACSTFPNALVTVNVGTISGSLGLYFVEASWLPAIYVAMNATGNLTLIKARAQFGIPAVMYALLTVYAVAALLQLAFPSFASAIVIRAISGMTAAALVTLTIYYLIEVFPRRLLPLAPIIGIGLAQLGTPLARVVPVELLAINSWRGLYLIELAVALGILALLLAFPLPPSQRTKAFEPLDLLTIGLIVPAMLLLCGVLGVGCWASAVWRGGSIHPGSAGRSLPPFLYSRLPC
jgi:MFS family permease